MKTLRHLLVGTDFSQCAEHALDSAIMLANLSHARITLVHVCALPADIDDALAFTTMDSELLDACAERLELAVARRAASGVVITGVMRSGRPWEKLANVAAEVGASLIVVGRQGAGGAPGFRLGTVAERLIATASRPVLVIPNDLAAGLRGGTEAP